MTQITVMNIFETLTDKEVQQWGTRHFAKGEILFREGEVCDCLSYVEKGQVEIVSYSFEGDEVLYNRIPAGGMFGNNLLFSAEPFYRGNALAKTDCRIRCLKKEELLILLGQNPQFLEAFLQAQAENAKRQNLRIKLLSFPSLRERLLYNLHLHDGRLEFSSVAALAREMGVERETLSRLLGKLESEGTILRSSRLIEAKRKTAGV